MGAGAPQPGRLKARYEDLAGDLAHRQELYIVRYHLGFGADEWHALPWWQRRVYLEGLQDHRPWLPAETYPITPRSKEDVAQMEFRGVPFGPGGASSLPAQRPPGSGPVQAMPEPAGRPQAPAQAPAEPVQLQPEAGGTWKEDRNPLADLDEMASVGFTVSRV